jgi:hypothetical protein
MLFTSQQLVLFALSGLGALAVAQTPSNKTQATEPLVGIDKSLPVQGGWKKEDNLSIVPLHPKARTGLIDPVLEEGLVAMGTVLASQQGQLDKADNNSSHSRPILRQRILRRA